MPEVEVFGRGIELNPAKNKALLFAGLGVVAILFLARRGGGPAQDAQQGTVAAPPVDFGPQMEFARLAAETDRELAALNAGNRLEERRIELSGELQREQLGLERFRIGAEQQVARERAGAEFAIAAGGLPALQRQCIPWGNWFALSKAEKDNLIRQVRDGALNQTPSAAGMCFTPTQRGLQGSEPRVEQRISTNLFRSRSTVTGPAGNVPTVQQPPRTGLDRLLDAAIAVYGGTQTGAGAPSDLPPGART